MDSPCWISNLRQPSLGVVFKRSIMWRKASGELDDDVAVGLGIVLRTRKIKVRKHCERDDEVFLSGLWMYLHRGTSS